jgi:general stress protein YciG
VSSKGRPPKKRSGFAAMDPERRREVARSGGLAAHKKGGAHQFTSDEARKAGAKGGRSVSRDREHMAEIGRKGGQARSGGASEGAPADDVREEDE